MTKPPLLLINGYAATAADWDPTFIAALERSFKLIRPENRGVGNSSAKLDGRLTIETMAADLEALLDARGIVSLPVAGWSMGGFIAQALAARAPRRVEALILLATDPGGADAVSAEPAVWARLTDNSGTPRAQAARLISLLFPPEVAAEIDLQFGEAVAAARAELSPAGLSAQAEAMATWHMTEQPPPPDLAPPVLIACGGEDVVIPPRNSDLLATLWPNSQIEHFAGCGHAFMAQEPERLAGLITSFLQDHSAW